MQLGVGKRLQQAMTIVSLPAGEGELDCQIKNFAAPDAARDRANLANRASIVTTSSQPGEQIIVFVSSTSVDMGEARELATETLRSAFTKVIYHGEDGDMKQSSQLIYQKLREKIAQSDFVFCIIGFRYGFEPAEPITERRRSYTQLEYDLAKEMNKEVVVLVAKENTPFEELARNAAGETAETLELQREFRREILAPQNKDIKEFETLEELREHLRHGIQLNVKRPRTPQPRDGRKEIGQAETFIARDWIVERFESFRTRPELAHSGGVFVVCGPSGVGKTALLTHWSAQTNSASFFFRHLDLNRPNEMLRSVMYQLGSKFYLDADLERLPLEQWPDKFRSALAAYSRRAGEPLLVFIDAIDECADRKELLRLLQPSLPLPPGVFLVLSERGEEPPRDLVRSFPRDCIESFVIHPNAARNLEDVDRYFRQRLGDKATGADAFQLARTCGGVFRIAYCLSEDLVQGKLSVAEALQMSSKWADSEATERLSRFYHESWERICRLADERPGEAEALMELLGFASVVMDWIDEDELFRILQRTEEVGCQCVDLRSRRGTIRWDDDLVYGRRLENLGWFLDRRSSQANPARRLVRIAHSSVHDFVWSGNGLDMRNPLEMQSRYHGCIGEYFHDAAEAPGGWKAVSHYGRSYTTRHLLRCGKPKSLEWSQQILTSLPFLEARFRD